MKGIGEVGTGDDGAGGVNGDGEDGPGEAGAGESVGGTSGGMSVAAGGSQKRTPSVHATGHEISKRLMASTPSTPKPPRPQAKPFQSVHRQPASM